jgi:hypothetical protein
MSVPIFHQGDTQCTTHLDHIFGRPTPFVIDPQEMRRMRRRSRGARQFVQPVPQQARTTARVADNQIPCERSAKAVSRFPMNPCVDRTDRARLRERFYGATHSVLARL